MPAPNRKLVLPIPVNIITGSLGSGKTTLIAQLIAQKPAGEHWAILVNEFGALGIDAAILQANAAPGDGITVQQLAGGCMCCTLAGAMAAGVAQLVRRAKPQRLIIEPSGLGHPAGLIDVLQSAHLRSSLRLQAVISLIDVSQVLKPAWQQNALIQDQLAVADVVVLSKADIASDADKAAACNFAAGLFPPKLRVVESALGHISLELLSISRDASLLVPRAPGHQLITPAAPDSSPSPAPLPAGPETSADAGDAGLFAQTAQASAADSGCLAIGKPLRFCVQNALPPLDPRDGRQSACGWMFHADDVFRREALLSLMQMFLHLVARAKGVFRVGSEYVVLRVGAGGKLELAPIAYRRESRFELIVDVPERREGRVSPGSAVDLSFLEGDALSLLDATLAHLDGAARVAAAVLDCDWERVESALVAALKPRDVTVT